MKKAIQIGVGNVGRGFIGALLSQAGYHVAFADVNMDIIDRINKERKYTVHVEDIHPSETVISGISGFLAADAGVMSWEIMDTELVTTAVGQDFLPYIAPVLAAALSARAAKTDAKPLNIIACEDSARASSQLKELVYERLSPEAVAWADSHAGFVDCVVDRMTASVEGGNPLDVAVEEFHEWDVEKSAFVGTAPCVAGMNLVEDLSAYVERKLFTKNMGRTITAYLGAMKGEDTIDRSIADWNIHDVVREAMRQGGAALVRECGFDGQAHYEYIDQVIRRFFNPCLRDEIMQAGRDPLRKLSASDRLVKPLLLAVEYGLPHDCLLLGIGAALHFDNPRDHESAELQNMLRADGLAQTIVNVTSIEAENPLVGEIVTAYSKVGRVCK